eukprot:1144232-Pelagomonas_calceolata.AAC.1
MGMKLQSKPGGCMSVKTKLLKRLQSVGGVAVLLLGGLKLVLGPGVFTAFDLHEMDVPLFRKELTRMTNLGRRATRSEPVLYHPLSYYSSPRASVYGRHQPGGSNSNPRSDWEGSHWDPFGGSQWKALSLMHVAERQA